MHKPDEVEKQLSGLSSAQWEHVIKWLDDQMKYKNIDENS